MEIRPYREGDEQQILKLFKLSFGKEMTIEYWNWRFKENPFLKTLMINLMWENETITGHYAVSASEICYKGNNYLSSLSGTTMTHPEYKGKGIFTELALSLYDRIANDYGITMVVGFPNQFSHYGLVKKIGWTDIAIIPTFRIHTDTLHFSSTEEIFAIEQFNDSHVSFIKDCIDNLGFEVYTNRSATYLNWRYLQCPVNKYYCLEYKEQGKGKGIIIGKEYQTSDGLEVDIVDFFCNEDFNTISMLFSVIKTHIEKDTGRKIEHINCWTSLHDPRHLEMERMGFRTSEPLTYMCTKPFLDGFEDVKLANKWYISMGDSDIY